jgi:formylglycine-generating enzyme required for sulfatase activity
MRKEPVVIRTFPALILLCVAIVSGVAQMTGLKKKNSEDGLEYAWIAPGSFQMGCSRDDCPPNERPAHKVMISRGFWIGATEVTTGAYKLFVQSTGRTMPPEEAQGFNVNQGWKNDRLPIVNVTWDEAAEYCKWVGGSLPSEAQWEYAAHGGSGQDPYGPLDEIAWTARNSGRQKLDAETLFKTDKAHYEELLKNNGNGPHEIGQKRANGFGLYDMIGNVAEFTADWADLSYYTHSPEQDPAGPTKGEARVLRGGHFLYPDTPNRASKRLWGDPSERSPVAGFRCVLP